MVSIVSKNTIDIVIIYDTTGKQIKEQINNKNSIEIDISTFSGGVYHFIVFSEAKKQSLKVIKK